MSSKPRFPTRRSEITPTVATNALSKNQRDKIEKRIAEIEAEIAKLEDEVAALSTEMSSPEVVADYTRLEKVSKKFREKEKLIQKRYEEWETASNELR